MYSVGNRRSHSLCSTIIFLEYYPSFLSFVGVNVSFTELGTNLLLLRARCIIPYIGRPFTHSHGWDQHGMACRSLLSDYCHKDFFSKQLLSTGKWSLCQILSTKSGTLLIFYLYQWYNDLAISTRCHMEDVCPLLTYFAITYGLVRSGHWDYIKFYWTTPNW